MEIVRAVMNHYGAADHIFYRKTIGEDCQIGGSVVGQQGRKIPGVIGVGSFGWIVVTLCVGKALSGTAASLVNMEGEKSAGIVGGKSGDVGFYQYAVGLLEKFHLTSQGGVVLTAGDICDSIRIQGVRIHQITSRQFMPGKEMRCAHVLCQTASPYLDGYPLMLLPSFAPLTL